MAVTRIHFVETNCYQWRGIQGDNVQRKMATSIIFCLWILLQKSDHYCLSAWECYNHFKKSTVAF